MSAAITFKAAPAQQNRACFGCVFYPDGQCHEIWKLATAREIPLCRDTGPGGLTYIYLPVEGR